MSHHTLPAHVLATRILSSVSPELAAGLGIPAHHRAAALLSASSDVIAYSAVDEATKRADCRVSYARSFYGGSYNASTKLAGEFLGVLSGPTPADVRSALEAARADIEERQHIDAATEDNSILYYVHCISRCGSYLAQFCQVPEGSSLAFLIAPPLEAIFGVDAVLKAVDVRICHFFGPPTETNFGGAFVTGEQSACRNACRVFSEAVEAVAANPRSL